MAVLNWGECNLFHADSTAGAAPKEAEKWKELPTPKEESTQLTTEAGSDKTATEEGGAIVDYMPGKNTYTLEFDLFKKAGEELPDWITKAVDGVVPGEHAFRIESQDKSTAAILIERAVVRVEDSYSTTDGTLIHVTAKALKPKEGNTVKYYDAKTKFQPSEAA